MKSFFRKLLLLLLCLVIVGVVGFGVFKHYSKVYPGEVSFFEGASARDVADILEVNGNIKSASAFYYYLRIKETVYDLNPLIDTTFKPAFKNGTFDIGEGDFEYLITYISDFKNHKKNAVPVQERFTTIPEGYSVTQTAAVLEKKNIVSSKGFLDLMNDANYYSMLQKKYYWLPAFDPKKKYQLEGFLHPNTYEFEKNSLPHTIIEEMLKGTDDFFEDNKIAILDSKLTFDELVTLASVVERESKFEADRAKVAQVFYNRLEQGMKLQSDITVLYSMDQHKTFVTLNDLKVDSPYNTYMYAGLPVGPINSPSLNALEAVLTPAGTSFDFVYFYARPNGETFYSKTLEEHEVIRKKYEQEWLDLDKK